MGLELQPISFAGACCFVERHHRHHTPSRGHKFSIAVNNGADIVGVAIIGRPVARHFDDGLTLEVTRCCTDGTKNACSKLYGSAWNAAKALGYRRLITYTLPSESGSSLAGAGWKVINAKAGGGTWSCKSRPRIDKHPLQEKILWEAPHQ